MHRFRPMFVLALALACALIACANPLPQGPPHSAAQPPSEAAARTGAVADVAAELRRMPGGSVRTGTARTGTARNERSGPTATQPAQLVRGSVNRTSVNMSATYDAALDLDFGTRAVTVDTTISATNTSGAPVDRLELNTIAARLGDIRLGTVTVNGRTVTPTIHDQTVLVPLGGILPQGRTVAVRVAYRATLRNTLTNSDWLFTRTNGIVNLYRWIPWVSRDVPFGRDNHGDPFVTAVSPRVIVRITTDRPLVLATTGDRVSANGLTQTFEARNVRDFTVTAAPDFRTGSRIVGNTTVRVWYRPGFPATAAVEEAARAVGRMNALVGTYPYKTYKVVQSAGGYGMESPGLIWIPTGIASERISYLVHHETAHQWFYGIVGADQAYEPFTDEAAADFLARYTLQAKRASRCSTARLDLSIYRYSAGCYYETIYIQGGNFLDDLRTRMGSTAFWKGMRAWVTANRFRIATTRSLLDTLDAHTPLDLVPRYERRFPRLY